MTQTNASTAQPHQVSPGKRMVAGAGIGLVLISLFLAGAGKPNPEWGKLWMLRPLIIVPLAGAMGGLCNYFIMRFHRQIGINKILALIGSVFVFIICLWLGIVLGLAGTMWD